MARTKYGGVREARALWDGVPALERSAASFWGVWGNSDGNSFSAWGAEMRVANKNCEKTYSLMITLGWMALLGFLGQL